METVQKPSNSDHKVSPPLLSQTFFYLLYFYISPYFSIHYFSLSLGTTKEQSHRHIGNTESLGQLYLTHSHEIHCVFFRTTSPSFTSFYTFIIWPLDNDKNNLIK
jgi:hypothetical protein